MVADELLGFCLGLLSEHKNYIRKGHYNQKIKQIVSSYFMARYFLEQDKKWFLTYLSVCFHFVDLLYD